MKGKTLGRIGAAVTALSMLGTMTAFADAPTIKDKDNGTSYNETTNTLTVAYDGASTTGDSTFLIWDATAIAEAFNPETTRYDGNGSDVFYVDQRDLKASATGSVAFPLSDKAKGTEEAPVYKVIIGMGGVGKTAAVSLFELRKPVYKVTAFETMQWTQPANVTFLAGKKDDVAVTTVAEITDKKDALNLPTTIKADTTDTAHAKVDLPITNWNIAINDTATGATLTPVVNLGDYVLNNDNVVPAPLNVAFTDEANVNITEWPASVTDNLEVAITRDEAYVLAELAKRTITIGAANVDFGEKVAPVTISFDWAADTTKPYDGTVADTYTFNATNVHVTSANAPVGTQLKLPASLEASLPSVSVVVANKTPVAITKVAFTSAEGGTVDENGNFTLTEKVARGTGLQALYNSGKLPGSLSIAALGDETVTPPSDMTFTITGWSNENYNASPKDDATVALTPIVEVRGSDAQHTYSYEGTLPTATVTVQGWPTITALDVSGITTALNVTAGTDEANAIKSGHANFPTQLAVSTLADNEQVPADLKASVVWDFSSYKADEAGTYTITANVTAPANYKMTIDPITVTVTVVSAAPTFTYGDVNNDGAVDMTDATYVFQIYMEQFDYDAAQSDTGFDRATINIISDVDGQDGVDMTDATYIFQKYMEIITKFPVEP